MVTPIQLINEIENAIETDPGTESKAMLFYCKSSDSYVSFLGCRSEARVLVIELE